jgi:hypothetical protein
MSNTPPVQEKISLNEMITQKVGELPPVRITKISWFPRRDAVSGMATIAGCPENERLAVLASMKPTVVKAGPDESCPFDPELKVASIFEDEDEYRIYCIGAAPKLACFRLSKSAPIFSLREFELGGFVDEIANEFISLRDNISSAEEERNAVLEYGETMTEMNGGVPYSLDEFLNDIRDGVHLADEEEEEEEEEKPAQIVVAKPAGVAGMPGPGAAVQNSPVPATVPPVAQPSS